MPGKPTPPPPSPRKPRADAQRNRERILEVAHHVFTRHGADATLNDIARQTRLGPGTLYRHFPTRDDLIEAVYRSEVEKLTAAAQRFTATMPPLPALRAWMLLFIDHVADKRLILPAMETVAGGSLRLIEGARNLIHSTFVTLVQHAITSGDLRPDTDPNDFVRTLVGVFHTTAVPGWEPSARRIVDILIAGSRPAQPPPPLLNPAPLNPAPLNPAPELNPAPPLDPAPDTPPPRTQEAVISTEAEAQRRRSGETPAFASQARITLHASF